MRLRVPVPVRARVRVSAEFHEKKQISRLVLKVAISPLFA